MLRTRNKNKLPLPLRRHRRYVAIIGFVSYPDLEVLACPLALRARATPMAAIIVDSRGAKLFFMSIVSFGGQKHYADRAF